MDSTAKTISATSVIVHRIVKKQGGKPEVVPRTSLLPLSPEVAKLIRAVAELYTGAASKKHGVFGKPQPGLTCFAESLEQHNNNDLSFIDLTVAGVNQLASKMEGVQFATGAYVLFFDWESMGTKFLYVAMLTDVEGSAISEDLEVLNAVHVDLEKLRVAGRVNLTEWQKPEGKQYLSILTGRGLGDVSTYFKRFIGIDEQIDEKAETVKLIDHFKEYGKNAAWTSETTQAVSQRLNEYLKQLSNEQRPMYIEDVSRLIDPENERAFSSFLESNGYSISSEVIPHKESLKRLVRVTGRNEHMSLSFEASLIGQGISLSSDGNTLLVNKRFVPDDVLAAFLLDAPNAAQ